MKEDLLGAEQELTLAPEEKIKNAEEIAQLSLAAETYPFIIRYDSVEKETVISELQRIGCSDLRLMDFANCVAVSMSCAQLKAIKTLGCVEAVERDYDYKVLSANGIDDAYIAYLAGEDPAVNGRKEIKLAIFDTGVSGVNASGSVNFVEETDTIEDPNGHGTKMAGIVSSFIADKDSRKAAPLVFSAIVADYRGFAKTSTIMKALDWAINNQIKIVSMSFGDYHKSNLLEEMINRAFKQGIVLVAAAGNDGSFRDEDRIMYPAAFSNVLSVGAKNGEAVANYSNGGTKVDCLAPGVQNTIDSNGNTVSVIGTSVATAFVAGTLFKKWCMDPDISMEEMVADVKAEMSINLQPQEPLEPLTALEENDIMTSENNNKDFGLSVVALDDTVVASSDGGISLLCVGGGGDSGSTGGCSSNTMATAIRVPFFSWETGTISCPGSVVWYKFTTTVGEAHPNGSLGWYGIQTQGSLDTVGYLFDAYGHEIDYNDDFGDNMNFKIKKQLEYGQTYYVKVEAFGNNTGSFHFKVDYGRDDHGNTPDTATEVEGVYYEDKSVSGYLHSYGDVDYYTFVPARNCVMEIYTEGDTNTYGKLYGAECDLIAYDNNSNGNGNFKITAHLEGMKRYYIAVSHNSSTGYGDYILRFKFIKDYMHKPDLGTASSPNYDNLRTYVNWIPNYMESSSTTLSGVVGAMPVYETETVMGRTWLNWSTAEHWNLHVIDNTEENAESIFEALAGYAAETVAVAWLVNIFKTVFKLANTKLIIAELVIGGIASLFASAIDTNSQDPEIEKFRDFARDITNDNSKWILSEGINYKGSESAHLYDPMHLVGTNEITYKMDNDYYFYGRPGMRGIFVGEFAK